MAGNELSSFYSFIQSCAKFPDGMGPTLEGFTNSIKLLKDVGPKKFESKYGLVLGVFQVFRENCLRNGFRVAVGCNDDRAADTCMQLLIKMNVKSSETSKTDDYSFNSSSRGIHLGNSNIVNKDFNRVKLNPICEVDDVQRSDFERVSVRLSENQPSKPIKHPTGKKNAVNIRSNNVNNFPDGNSDDRYISDNSDSLFKPSTSKINTGKLFRREKHLDCSNQVTETKSKKYRDHSSSECSETDSSQPPTNCDFRSERKFYKKQRASNTESKYRSGRVRNIRKGGSNNCKCKKRIRHERYSSDEKDYSRDKRNYSDSDVILKKRREYMSSEESDSSESSYVVVRKKSLRSRCNNELKALKNLKCSKAASRPRKRYVSSSPSPLKNSNRCKNDRSVSYTDSEADNRLRQRRGAKIRSSSLNMELQKSQQYNDSIKKRPAKSNRNKASSSNNSNKDLRNKKEKSESSVVINAPDSKFVARLKQLESSVLKGTPDPLIINRSKASTSKDGLNKKLPGEEGRNVVQSKSRVVRKKTNAKSDNTSNNINETSVNALSSKTVDKKSQAPTKSKTVIKKLPAAQMSKAANKKTAAIKASSSKKKSPVVAKSRKADTKKVTKVSANKKVKTSAADGNSNECSVAEESSRKGNRKLSGKDRPQQESNKKKSIKKLKDHREYKSKNKKTTKTSAQDKGKKTEAIAPQPEEVENNDVKDTDVEELSALSSEDVFGTEPELGTLSSCLNSIKKKLPLQLGTATPPLKIFLSNHSDAHSEYSDDNSSFAKLSMKLDDKNVVKRMAKANKPKQMPDHPHSDIRPKSKRTPEAIRKFMELKKTTERDSDLELECSSFSDE